MTAGLTLQGQTSTVAALPRPMVYTGPTFSGPWTYQDTAIFESVAVFSGSEGVDRLVFTLPYGNVYSGVRKAFASQSPASLDGQWAQLGLLDPDGSVATVFVGQIRGVEANVFGSDSDVAPAGPTPPRPKGMQQWQAFGGQLFLQLAAISAGYCVSPPQGSGSQSAGVVRVGWAPAFNHRDSHGFFLGNRSASPAADDAKSYVFGGTTTWTRRQAIDYVLKRFANTNSKIPTFTLAGQLEVLDASLKILEVGVTDTVLTVLRKIIAHQEGIEFGVHPAFDGQSGAFTGYEIEVFTLVAAPVTFRSSTIPANANTISFSTADMKDVADLKVATDRTHTASRIRLVGDRIVVCATLLGTYLAGPNDDVLTSTTASLLGKWTSALETAYKAGAPSLDPVEDPADQHDSFRARPEFETVYRRYGLPTGFVRPAGWLPSFDGTGNLSTTPATYQDAVRETLSWIPLLQGYDYTTNPATNANPSTADVDVCPPLVIAEDRKDTRSKEDPIGAGSTQSSKPFADASQLGIAHSALKHDLGVWLHATPAHRLAYGRGAFDGTGGTAVSRLSFGSDPKDPEDEGHAIDPKTLAATIAWKSDARFVLEYALDAATDDGTVIEVAVPDAQIWWLAPTTLVGIKTDKTPAYSGSTGVVLRNDADLYASTMAGMIARYLVARHKVDFTFHGWRPWVGLLGSILTTIEEGGKTSGVNAPITSVELHGGANNTDPRTIVRAGFAHQ